MTTASSADTCPESGSEAAAPQASPSSEPPASTVLGADDPAMAIDAPVLALIARLHAGTTLADRVRRMRGRRAGMAAHRKVKAKVGDLITETAEPEERR